MKNSQKGFALPISLMLLIVMAIMGTALVSITSGDMRSNKERDSNSQAFYAAESGISMAKQYLKNQKNYNSGVAPNVRFCYTNLFPNLRQGTVKTINNFVGRNNLGDVMRGIGASGKEVNRLNKFSYEFFITYSPDKDGNTNSAQTKPGTKQTLYTIHSCGCDGSVTQCRSQNNNIVSLEAVVTIIE